MPEDIYNDKDSAAYLSPLYRKNAILLDELDDCYEGQTRWQSLLKIIDLNKLKTFLPQWYSEPDENYQRRALDSRYVNRFRRAVIGFTGLLTNYEIGADVPDWIVNQVFATPYGGQFKQQRLKVINSQSENQTIANPSFRLFKQLLDEYSLKDGWVAVIVDADENGYYYASIIRRIDVLQYKPDEKFVYTRRNEDLNVDEIMVYYPGVRELWILDRDELTLVETKNLVDIKGNLLSNNPVVIYPQYSEDMGFLLEVAFNDIAWYRENSQYTELRFRCSSPIPVLKTDDQKSPVRMVLSPTNVIKIPTNGDFYFAEISASSIESNRQACVDIERRTLQQTLAFFSASGSQQQMTDDEVHLRSTQTRSELELLADRTDTAVKKLFDCINLWEGEPDSDGYSGISTDVSITHPVSVQVLSFLRDLVIDGLMDSRTFYETLNAQSNLIPNNVSLDDLMKRNGIMTTPES